MVKQKIFDTALSLIEVHGTKVSVRQIASVAEVNVAAINYHFGSKDNLINEIIVYKLEQFKYAFDGLTDKQIEPLVRLQIFVCELVELIIENPEVADYIIDQHDLFKTRYEYQLYLQTIGYDNLVKLMTEITNIDDQLQITVMIEHVLAASVISYVNQLKLANRHPEYVFDHDYKQAIELFIDNYFYRFRI